MALLIGIGVGYLLGIKGFGQKVGDPGTGVGQQQFPQQQNFGPVSGNQAPQQGGSFQQPQSQGEAPAGALGGRNPLPSGGVQQLPQQGGQQGQPASPVQRGEPLNQPQR